MNKYKSFATVFVISFCFFVLPYSRSYARSPVIPFSFKTLTNEIMPVDSLLQKGPVLITFWAMWCKPCKEELHALSKVHSEYPFDSITIVSVTIDTPRSIDRVKSYVKTHNFPFICSTDPGKEILRIFNVSGIPFTVILNKKREVIMMHSGYVPGDLDEYGKKIESCLKTGKE
ncbi:TlpA family protein disulfide reductase [bacterium]|nr:TlpA family protein disulfide reductase [bacterium]